MAPLKPSCKEEHYEEVSVYQVVQDSITTTKQNKQNILYPFTKHFIEFAVPGSYYNYIQLSTH